MRRVAGIAALAGVVLAVGGCTSAPAPHPGPSTPVAPSVAPTRSLDPASAAVCTDARGLIRRYTAAFTAQEQAANAALDRGDRAAATRSVAAIRTTFGKWSAAMRHRAVGVADPDLQLVLTEYAGGIDATIARVRTLDDLDSIYTFTEKELDVAASRLVDVCPEPN